MYLELEFKIDTVIKRYKEVHSHCKVRLENIMTVSHVTVDFSKVCSYVMYR